MFKGAVPIDEAEATAPFTGAVEVDEKKLAAQKLAADKQREDDKKLYDPAAGMSPLEKGVVGVGRSFDRLYRGARDLVRPDETVSAADREERERERDSAKVYEAHHPGGWATAGEVVGDVVATAPLGGVLGAASKALPAAGRLAAVGGRFVNPGTAGRAATEAATVAGVQAPGEGETRLGNMGQAAALGGAASKVVPALVRSVAATGKYAGRKALDLATGGQRQTGINAINSLDRTIGKEAVDAAAESVRSPTPSMFPRTTAAMSGDRQLGALEAGAMNRPGAAGFMKHREDVARKSWGELQDATRSATHDVPGLDALDDDAAEAAIAAAQRVRGSFMKEGVPTTTRSFGQITEGNAVPDIGESALRRTLARNGGKMVPEEAANVGRIADELGPQEISSAAQMAGPTNIEPSGLVQKANAFMNVLPAWRWRGVAQSLIQGSNKKEQALIDQALLDPQKFLQMVETQRALGRPLTGWQGKLRDAMLGAQAREIGAQSAGD